MQAMFLNERLIAYQHRTGGAGPCIVFANSLGSDQSLWDDVIAHLPGGFDLLTYDLPGHGLSESMAETSIAQMADDLIGLITALGIEDVILCGVSVGGMIAQAVAARCPDFLTGLVLICTAPTIGTAAKWDDRIKAVMTNGLPAVADSVLHTWVAPDYRARNAAAMALHRSMLNRVAPEGYAALCAAIRAADLTEHAAKITVPTLCIAGEHDQSVPPAQMAAMADRIPGATFECFDNTGHLPPFETPSRLARRIEQAALRDGSRDARGMAVRRKVLGHAHVDRAEAAKTSLDTAFQQMIIEGAWGTVWDSPGLALRDRSMITLALLAALGNFDEIPMHVRATQRTGASERDLQEVFQHVAIYAGVPRANHALKLVRKTLAEMREEPNE